MRINADRRKFLNFPDTNNYSPNLIIKEVKTMEKHQQQKTSQTPPHRHAQDISASMLTCSLNIDGLDCADCALKIENSASALKGLANVRVNAVTSRIKFDYNHDENTDAVADVRKLVDSMGYRTSDIEGQERVTIRIPEMDCSEEVRLIKGQLDKVDGVLEMSFLILNRELRLTLDTTLTGREFIASRIRDLGMTPEFSEKQEKSGEAAQTKIFLGTTVLSGVFILIAVVLMKVFKLDTAAIPLFFLSMTVGGYFIGKRAFYSIRYLNIDMNVLMTIAVIGAAILGEWGEAATVVFLFSLAQLLEHYSMDRSRNAVKELMELAPDDALIRRDGEIRKVATALVQVGETMIVKPGMRIPLDGSVISGSSFVNQSPVTGESMPVEKKEGDVIYAGTINEKGALEVQVTRRSGDSTIARISRMVEEAQAKKAPAQNFIDRFSRYYTPIVITIAFLVAVIPPLFYLQPWHNWIYRSLVLLMIACPCALVISTPISIVSGLTRAAKDGVLIKGGIHLENFANTEILALDKTGTITRGKPEVVEIIPLNHNNVSEILSISAAVENLSEHPIALAVVEKAKSRGIVIPNAIGFKSVTGLGAEALVGGKIYFVGSHRFFEERKICSEEAHELVIRLESEGNTVIMAGDEERPIGIMVVRDTLREGVQSAIDSCLKEGVKKVVMLTGDNEETARAIAKKLGISYKAGLLPEDKVLAIDKMKKTGGKTAMVGDGINDAPALASADVGVAMGAAGTDTALEVADIALMSDDLEKIPYTLRLSRRTLGIIKQNIIIALGLKIVFLVLGILGIATLWMAVFADMGASLIVIFNGLRLLRFRG